MKALLELYPESSQMNVLDKNGFGKSSLTDVCTKTRIYRKFDFSVRYPSLAFILLNHQYASFIPWSGSDSLKVKSKVR